MLDDEQESVANIPPSARVLVAVITRPCDLLHARTQAWYRIPLARAPQTLMAEYLAFYLTATFGVERWAVRYIALVRNISIVPRRILLPEESAHPRADERYYRFALGPLWRLTLPVSSRRLRRITFIPTTFGQLIRADDITSLWHPPEDTESGWPEIWAAG